MDSDKFDLENVIIVLLLQMFFMLIAVGGHTFDIFKEAFKNNEALLTVILFLTCILSLSAIFLVYKLYVLTKERKKFEIERIKLKHQQELVKKLRSQKHDFSNHLQAIYGMIQLNKFQEALEYIKSVSENLRKKSESKKDSPLVSMGKIKMERSSIEKKSTRFTILDPTLISMKKKAKKAEVSFYYQIDSEVEKLEYPLDKIVQIVFNLTENAIEATQEYNGEKYIEVIGEDNKKNYVIRVYNSGPIISSELIEIAFEPGISTRGEDRGFGLYIVKTLIEELGGKLDIKSNKEFGTQFTCYFPK